jgi:hypothetical protein
MPKRTPTPLTVHRIRRPAPEPRCGDDRPVGYQCWGCARHFPPVGAPQPVRRGDYQWRETICDDPECPGNKIAEKRR